jgi:hypothetical protein
MTTTHVAVPLHPLPPQPPNVDPAEGVAVSVTVVPLLKVELQVVPQLMPEGLLVTVPSPAPALVTARVNVFGVAKLAMTVWLAFIATIHEPVPLHPAPLQPPNVDPADGVAVNVTVVPLLKVELQVVPQLMPEGLLITVPSPAPALVTARVNVFGVAKLAVTVWLVFIATIHEPVPLHPAPLQPVNVEPAAGAAVRVTVLPIGKSASQVVPHEMPPGLLDTVPFPDFMIVKLRVSAVMVKLSACSTIWEGAEVSRSVNVCEVVPWVVGVPVIAPVVAFNERLAGSAGVTNHE